MLHKKTIAFSWLYPEFIFVEKKKSWYWFVGIIGLVVVILAIILRNYLFAFLLLLGTFLIMLLSNKRPQILEVSISEYGVQDHYKLFPYKDISAFWIKENIYGEPILLLKTNQKINPVIKIPIDTDIDLIALRDYLSHFVEEKEISEPLSEQLIENTGF